MWKPLVFLTLFFVRISAFPRVDIVNTSLWLSSASYCPTNYLNHSFIGPSLGFVPIANIQDPKTDTNGYVGYLDSQETIFVVFRGSSSLANWYTNLDLITVPYSACDGCLAHEGFMYAFSQVKEQVYANVKFLQEKYPAFKIVVTGHSLGGALATLTSLDMIQNGFPKEIQLVTFGQPRVGNVNFAEFASASLLNPIRITHYRDSVPHVPYHRVFFHTSREWYEDNLGVIHTCEGLEDPSCAYQWYYTTISDHMTYLGLNIGCKYVSNENERKRLIAERFVEPEESIKHMKIKEFFLDPNSNE